MRRASRGTVHKGAARQQQTRAEKDKMLVWVAVILALIGNVVAATALSMTILQARHRSGRHALGPRMSERERLGE
jgi:hypothetical protein